MMKKIFAHVCTTRAPRRDGSLRVPIHSIVLKRFNRHCLRFAQWRLSHGR
jgi:hypothetical protein